MGAGGAACPLNAKIFARVRHNADISKDKREKHARFVIFDTMDESGRDAQPRAPRTTQPRIADAAHAAHATRIVLFHWARQNTHAKPSPHARSTAKAAQRAAPRLSEQHKSSAAKSSAAPVGQGRHRDESRAQPSKRSNAGADGWRARDAHRLLLGEPERRPRGYSRSSRSRRPPRPGSSRCRCSNRIEGPHRCADDLQRSRRSTSPRAEGRGARARGLAPAPAHLCRQLPDMSELEAGITRGRQLPAAASCPRQTVRVRRRPRRQRLLIAPCLGCRHILICRGHATNS